MASAPDAHAALLPEEAAPREETISDLKRMMTEMMDKLSKNGTDFQNNTVPASKNLKNTRNALNIERTRHAQALEKLQDARIVISRLKHHMTSTDMIRQLPADLRRALFGANVEVIAETDFPAVKPAFERTNDPFVQGQFQYVLLQLNMPPDMNETNKEIYFSPSLRKFPHSFECYPRSANTCAFHLHKTRATQLTFGLFDRETGDPASERNALGASDGAPLVRYKASLVFADDGSPVDLQALKQSEMITCVTQPPLEDINRVRFVHSNLLRAVGAPAPHTPRTCVLSPICAHRAWSEPLHARGSRRREHL